MPRVKKSVETLAQARALRERNQEYVAKKIGVSQGFVSMVENAERFPEVNLDVWCRVYGIKTQKEFRRLWGNSFQLPLWRFAQPDEPQVDRLEGQLAVLYSEAPIIGQTEQQRRQA